MISKMETENFIRAQFEQLNSDPTLAKMLLTHKALLQCYIPAFQRVLEEKNISLEPEEFLRQLVANQPHRKFKSKGQQE